MLEDSPFINIISTLGYYKKSVVKTHYFHDTLIFVRIHTLA